MTLSYLFRTSCVVLLLAAFAFPVVGQAADASSNKGLSFGSAVCGTPTPCAQWRSNVVLDPKPTIALAQSCLAQRLGIPESTAQFAETRPDSNGCMVGKGQPMASGYILYPTCCIAPTAADDKLCVIQCQTNARPK